MPDELEAAPLQPGEPTPPTPFGFPAGIAGTPAERDALLLLACLLGIDAFRLRALLWREGSATGALAAVRAGHAGSDGDRAFLDRTDVADVRARLLAASARFAAPGDVDYWPALLRLPDPPVAMFARGNPLGPGDARVAVVGTRRPTRVGADVAADIGAGLAAAGAVVVSGGALGIDAIAHRAALEAGGGTIAVLGSGIDRDTPRANAGLLERVGAQGTILSEFAPGVEAQPFFFPYRNRLIAGLSQAIVVIEGTSRSGTRSTAARAMELGLPVYAVPGPVTSPLSETPHELLREGAQLIRGADDLLLDLGLVDRSSNDRPAPTLPPLQARVFAVLTEATLPDMVARRASLSVADAVEALIGLELRGLVRGVGGRYERIFGGGAASHVEPDVG